MNSIIPEVDIRETVENYQIILDVPGVSKNDVTVYERDGNLVVEGSRIINDTVVRPLGIRDSSFEENPSEFPDGVLVKSERLSGEFKRTFVLGKNIQVDQIKNKLENGVLSITLPKTKTVLESETKKVIPIE